MYRTVAAGTNRQMTVLCHCQCTHDATLCSTRTLNTYSNASCLSPHAHKDQVCLSWH